MRCADPVREMAEHVEEYLVAVADEEGTAHLSSALRASISSIGWMLSASAQARRSGSCASRKRTVATSKAGSPTPNLRSLGERPVTARDRNSVDSGMSVPARVDLDGRRIIKT